MTFLWIFKFIKAAVNARPIGYKTTIYALIKIKPILAYRLPAAF